MFQCNLCNQPVTGYEFEEIGRETGICPTCGSFARARAITFLLSKALYGSGKASQYWEPRDATVYGVSDWPGFSPVFERYVRYVNTQFDRTQYPTSTFLDITAPPDSMLGTADVVICSDVLEHVPPPVQAAFDGLLALLKPGGTLVLTVPYSMETTAEHFPDLNEWHLERRHEASVLVNTTRDGRREEFSDLVFHGGGVDVLEMRLFGLDSLLRHFGDAGFVDVTILDEDIPDFGIRFGPGPWSRAITARRPYLAPFSNRG